MKPLAGGVACDRRPTLDHRLSRIQKSDLVLRRLCHQATSQGEEVILVDCSRMRLCFGNNNLNLAFHFAEESFRLRLSVPVYRYPGGYL